MEEEFVIFKGKKYYVKDNILNLSKLKITDIDEIRGLENLTNLILPEKFYLKIRFFIIKKSLTLNG